MPLLSWTNDLATGIRAIDADHRMLFDITNALHESVVEGGKAQSVGPHLAALARYIEEHFEREETFMERSGYPRLAEHMREHQELVQSIHGLQQLHQDNPTALRESQVWEFLTMWLNQHIRKSDMDYVPFVSGRVRVERDPAVASAPAIRAVTVRVPAAQVDTIFRCAAVLSEGGSACDALTRLVAPRT